MPTCPAAPRHGTARLAPLFPVLAAMLIGLIVSPARDAHVAGRTFRAPHTERAAIATATRKRIVHKRVAPVAPKLSEFAREQRMTPGQLINRWRELIAQASQRFDVPQPWIRAVLAAESGGRTMAAENRPLTSSAGALGLMQLMPQTYDDMRAEYRLGADPHDPHDNIFAGAAYLRLLFLRYGYPAMFSAYNSGPGNLEDRLRDGGLLPEETRTYTGEITHALATGTGLHGIRVKFTRPDGTKIWIDSAAVVAVRAALSGEYAPGVLCVITVGRIRQGVREDVARVRTILHMRAART